MTPRELEDYLHGHIPLSKAMEARVVSVNEQGVELSAPLAPNLNHRGTAFGGSISTLAILSAWSLLHVRLTAAGLDARIVIHKSEIDYLKPIPGAFTALCVAPEPASWETFFAAFRAKRKARMTLVASVRSEGTEAARMTGKYVALAHP
jgi:thioesterase domain-containing protein